MRSCCAWRASSGIALLLPIATFTAQPLSATKVSRRNGASWRWSRSCRCSHRSGTAIACEPSARPVARTKTRGQRSRNCEAEVRLPPSARATANSVTTRIRRVLVCRPEPVDPRVSDLTADMTSTWPACSAGARPKMVDATVATSAKHNASQLTVISLSRGRPFGRVAAEIPWWRTDSQARAAEHRQQQTFVSNCHERQRPA